MIFQGEFIGDEFFPQNEKLYHKFCAKYNGQKGSIDIEPQKEGTWSQQMYKYYYKVIVPTAQAYYRDVEGYDLDKTNTDMALKTDLNKDLIEGKDGRMKEIVRQKSGQSKREGVEFIDRCIRFLAENGYVVPDPPQKD